MGGSRWEGINDPANLITLCGTGTTGCHGWVESHPEWAKAHGWSVSVHQRDQVAQTPVWTWRGWVRLVYGVALPAREYDGVDGCMCGCRPLETTTGVWDTPMGDRA